MTRVINRFLIGLGLILSATVQAQGDLQVQMLKPAVDVSDKAALQRGARIFMNYCSGCHSLQYLRYNRMAVDLGLVTFDGAIDKDLLYNNLIFTTAKEFDPIEVAIPPEGARQWFGKVPPDLTLTAKQRGLDWIYTYLKSFYADPSRPFGSNNLLFPDVAMPNVLYPLQGEVRAVKRAGQPDQISHLLLVKNGEMNEPEFNSALSDLVTFLAYAAEPEKTAREHLGIWVLLYLFILLILVYQLKKIYWKKL